jgi:excisionase family DNA binding protein
LDRRPLLTIQEAARYLSVSVSTLYGWVWQRRIPFVKIGRALRFDPTDLEAYIEASKQYPDKAQIVPLPAAIIRPRLAKGRKEAASGNLPKKTHLVD